VMILVSVAMDDGYDCNVVKMKFQITVAKL